MTLYARGDLKSARNQKSGVVHKNPSEVDVNAPLPVAAELVQAANRFAATETYGQFTGVIVVTNPSPKPPEAS
jgi:hypothetical protein